MSRTPKNNQLLVVSSHSPSPAPFHGKRCSSQPTIYRSFFSPVIFVVSSKQQQKIVCGPSRFLEQDVGCSAKSPSHELDFYFVFGYSFFRPQRGVPKKVCPASSGFEGAERRRGTAEEKPPSNDSNNADKLTV